MKKEEIVEQAPPEPDNPLMRKKKTPEELAREAEEAELDDFTSKYFLLQDILCVVVIASTADVFGRSSIARHCVSVVYLCCTKKKKKQIS